MRDIEKDEVLEAQENPDKLRSSAVSEIYKIRLQELMKSESLSRKERSKILEIKKLLNKIAEIKIQEPKMLLRIIEVFNPVNQFH